jgi:hypothetical protein
MIEAITSLADLQKKYEVVKGRKPKKNDLVFVASQGAVFEVIHVESMNVKVERKHKGSGLFLVLPPSQYKIVEKK